VARPRLPSSAIGICDLRQVDQPIRMSPRELRVVRRNEQAAPCSHSRRSVAPSALRRAGSSAAVGSSISSKWDRAPARARSLPAAPRRGELTRPGARARADIKLGQQFRRDRFRLDSGLAQHMRSASVTLPCAVRCSNSACAWNTSPTPGAGRRAATRLHRPAPVRTRRRRSALIEPLERGNGAQRRRLPAPDGPMSATSSPRATSSERARSTSRVS